MSDNDYNSDVEIKTLSQIRKDKKEKKPLTEEATEKRRQNMYKALEARKSKYENKQKEKNNINLIHNNIASLLKDDSESENEKKSYKSYKTNITDKKVVNNDDELKTMISKINSRVEKLYIMKKNKPPKQQLQPQPIIISDNHKNMSVLDSIRNKMLNQV